MLFYFILLYLVKFILFYFMYGSLFYLMLCYLSQFSLFYMI